MGRMVGQCMNCKEDDKELVAHGLCKACYEKHRRNTDPQVVQHRQVRFVKEQDKLVENLARLRKYVNAVPCFLDDEKETILAIVNRHIADRVADDQKAAKAEAKVTKFKPRNN